MESYEFLRWEYRRILDNGLLSRAIGLFRDCINLADRYTDIKVIDTLIWKFSECSRQGQFKVARSFHR
ncbi:MAG: hypothetical protein MZV70_46850 [Desulfobacterales bacterium]|nr:hypothetical protein [Desulfobacterales bacterium]